MRRMSNRNDCRHSSTHRQRRRPKQRRHTRRTHRKNCMRKGRRKRVTFAKHVRIQDEFGHNSIKLTKRTSAAIERELDERFYKRLLLGDTCCTPMKRYRSAYVEFMRTERNLLSVPHHIVEFKRGGNKKRTKTSKRGKPTKRLKRSKCGKTARRKPEKPIQKNIGTLTKGQRHNVKSNPEEGMFKEKLNNDNVLNIDIESSRRAIRDKEYQLEDEEKEHLDYKRFKCPEEIKCQIQDFKRCKCNYCKNLESYFI